MCLHVVNVFETAYVSFLLFLLFFYKLKETIELLSNVLRSRMNLQSTPCSAWEIKKTVELTL